MLYDAETTRRVARTLKDHFGAKMPPLVLDPVVLSTSSHSLLAQDAIEVVRSELFPLAALVTPNAPEAQRFLPDPDCSKLENLETMLDGVTRLLDTGAQAVLIKGGHVNLTMVDVERVCTARPEARLVYEGFLDGENMEILRESREDLPARPVVVDVLCQSAGKGMTLFVRPRIESTSTHGTGCTLSAAIACGLSRGESSRFLFLAHVYDSILVCDADNILEVVEAVRQAAVYTHLGIESTFPIGHGHGPLNHLHALTTRLIPRWVA